MHQRFGKPFFRQEFRCFQFSQQGIDILAFLRITRKLFRQFGTTMLAR